MCIAGPMADMRLYVVLGNNQYIFSNTVRWKISEWEKIGKFGE